MTYIENNQIKDRISNYEDIQNILFIPEVKYYNPEAYNDCVEYIDAFLEKYEIIKIEPRQAAYLYDNMVDDKKYIINLLISVSIYSPNEYNLGDVIKDMNNILDKYLLEVYNIYQNYLSIAGYDYTTNIINLNHPDAYNIDDNIVEPGKKLLFNRV